MTSKTWSNGIMFDGLRLGGSLTTHVDNDSSETPPVWISFYGEDSSYIDYDFSMTFEEAADLKDDLIKQLQVWESMGRPE